MINSNHRMLLRVAQADTCGMAVEYIKEEHSQNLFEALKFDRYVKHPVLTDVKQSCYTDDTHMSIAVAEALIASPDIVPTSTQFADAFIKVFKLDPREGYSKRILKMLQESSTGDELIIAGGVEPSDFNGAAMRACPLGVIANPIMLMRAAENQAIITHNTPAGIVSAQAVGLMSHFALYLDDPFDRLQQFLEGYLGDQVTAWRTPWRGRVATKRNMGLTTVHAVLTLLKEQKSLMDIMKTLLVWGGDTDSVAAIAWGIASSRYQNEELPEFMERDLEPGGLYGPTFLRYLGCELMNAYPSPGFC